VHPGDESRVELYPPRDAHHASAIAQGADGVVVGSALVEAIRTSLDANGKATEKTVSAVTDLVSSLSKAVHSVARRAAE